MKKIINSPIKEDFVLLRQQLLKSINQIEDLISFEDFKDYNDNVQTVLTYLEESVKDKNPKILSDDLFSVKLNKRDTCLTYVLKRKGIVSPIAFSSQLKENTISLLSGDYKFKKGDIVGWISKEETMQLSIGITTHRSIPLIVKQPVFTKYHWGIIESISKYNRKQLITVSHSVRNLNSVRHPEIKINTLNLIKDGKSKKGELRFPDVILNL